MPQVNNVFVFALVKCLMSPRLKTMPPLASLDLRSKSRQVAAMLQPFRCPLQKCHKGKMKEKTCLILLT